jgi:HAD superfamily hydrolase (TIGR01549 family)
VLFDLDDTLFDHRHAARQALTRVHQMHACFAARQFTVFEDEHARFLELLHRRVLAGEMGIDEARLERFRLLFDAAGATADETILHETAMAYRHRYLETRRPVDGARDLLAAIKPLARVAIVSNNLLDEQQQKLRLCGFDAYIDELVVSEEAGSWKPDRGIFDTALARLGCEAADAVMIGDSWTADVEGARAAGIRAIWFNPAAAVSSDPAIAEIAAWVPIEAVLESIFGTADSRPPAALAARSRS